MKLTKKTAATAIALGLGAALTLGSTAAMAFGGKDGDRGMMGRKGGFMQLEFADVDLDKNGQITAEDLQAAAEARFVAADTDGDGALSLDEMKAQAEKRMAERLAMKGKGKGDRAEKRMTSMLERMLAKKDADGNGSLSLEETLPEQAKFERMIDRFDTDDDNAVSQAEFDAAKQEMSQRHGKRGGHGGKDCDRKG
ncbi:EF hand [Aliiroseovarius halocynthiae]|uniref:Calcium sensor EFh n=1 Tax=Aliiroseovarius halocynthiae TaxID=985055 RepID=A0A545SVD8_9RHOB|nr:EF-hand domain-containing protein [Aliiroseovarius halocynthiae]TQV68899.1 calcium sensor EFh [Aliiroseovarius halocynthiae]SMR71448.1 EF hand [Aliiroseovarius halocynthiae]